MEISGIELSPVIHSSITLQPNDLSSLSPVPNSIILNMTFYNIDVNTITTIASLLWDKFKTCHYSTIILSVMVTIDLLILLLRCGYFIYSLIRGYVMSVVFSILGMGGELIAKIVNWVATILTGINWIKKCCEDVFDTLNILRFKLMYLKESQLEIEERSSWSIAEIKKNKYLNYNWKTITKRASSDEILSNSSLPWDSEISTSTIIREKGVDVLYENRNKIAVDMNVLSSSISLYHACEYKDWQMSLLWTLIYSRCEDEYLDIFDEAKRDSVLLKINRNHPIYVQKTRVDEQRRSTEVPKIADLGAPNRTPMTSFNRSFKTFSTNSTSEVKTPTTSSFKTGDTKTSLFKTEDKPKTTFFKSNIDPSKEIKLNITKFTKSPPKEVQSISKPIEVSRFSKSPLKKLQAPEDVQSKALIISQVSPDRFSGVPDIQEEDFDEDEFLAEYEAALEAEGLLD